MKFEILDPKEYENIYSLAFEEPSFNSEFTADDLDKDFRILDDHIQGNLKKSWVDSTQGGFEDFEEHDYEISDEFQNSFHHCGGIYSERILSIEYLKALINAISKTAQSDKWTYHTSIEVDDVCDGECFVKNGKVYFPQDEHDYPSLFGLN